MSHVQEIRADLLGRLNRLTRRAGKIAADLRRPGSADWQERAVEIENDEVLEGLDTSTQAEVQQIREALQRIDEGSYGSCSRCDKQIAGARLRAIPHTTLCIGCADSD